MRTASLLATGVLLLPLAGPASAAPTPEVTALLSRIKGVGREGAGNEDAARAWKALVRQGPGVLPDVLAAMDVRDQTASNWVRTAADAIAERALALRWVWDHKTDALWAELEPELWAGCNIETIRFAPTARRCHTRSVG